MGSLCHVGHTTKEAHKPRIKSQSTLAKGCVNTSCMALHTQGTGKLHGHKVGRHLAVSGDCSSSNNDTPTSKVYNMASRLWIPTKICKQATLALESTAGVATSPSSHTVASS